VKAWDDHLLSVNVAEKEKAAKQEAQEWAERRKLQWDRQWRLSQALIDKTEAVLRLPLIRTRVDKDGTTTVIEPVRVRLADAGRLGDVASQLARAAIEDARADAEQSGATATKIINAVFSPGWGPGSERATTPPDESPDEDGQT
jgi:hypothetical protein